MYFQCSGQWDSNASTPSNEIYYTGNEGTGSAYIMNPQQMIRGK